MSTSGSAYSDEYDEEVSDDVCHASLARGLRLRFLIGHSAADLGLLAVSIRQ